MFEIPKSINIDIDFINVLFLLVPLILLIVIIGVVFIIIKSLLSKTN